MDLRGTHTEVAASRIGGNDLSTSRTNRGREWLIIIAVVIGLHALLFITVRPAFFSMFKKTVTSTADGNAGEPFAPAAILTIPIEIEDQPEEQQNPVQEATDPTRQDRKKKREDEARVVIGRAVSDKPGQNEPAPVDIENVIGQSMETLPHNFGPEEVMIPPRAIEITWPDVSRLQHCQGHHIDMKVQVNEKGEIMTIEPLDRNHPDDCIRAALESAGRIVFEPGKVNGEATPMWTQVRIEFRKAR